MTFIQSRNYSTGRDAPTRLIVVHTTENDCVPGMARDNANFFASGNAPQASTHYFVDPVEVIQTVSESDTAWAAPPLNGCAIHIEHTGHAAYTSAEWQQPNQMAMLQRSAELVVSLSARHQIPAERISDADLVKILRGDYNVPGGIVSHVDINRVARALGLAESDHTDPGPSWPWMNYLAMIRGSFPSTTPLGEPDMPLTPADQTMVRAAVADALAAAIPVIATQAAVQVWTRYRMANNGGLVDLQTSVSLLLAGLPADAARDAAVAAAVAAVPALTVEQFSTALNPPPAAA